METTTQRDGVIVSAMIPIDLREELVRRAEAADRSLSAQIRRALSEHIEHQENSNEWPALEHWHGSARKEAQPR